MPSKRTCAESHRALIIPREGEDEAVHEILNEMEKYCRKKIALSLCKINIQAEKNCITVELVRAGASVASFWAVSLKVFTLVVDYPVSFLYGFFKAANKTYDTAFRIVLGTLY